MQNAQVGTVKMTMPIAWTTAMVAWGMLDFKEGYAQVRCAAVHSRCMKHMRQPWCILSLPLHSPNAHAI